MDIKYAYYNTSKGYRVLGGTAVHFLKADGSLDGTEYIDKTSFQDITGIKSFTTYLGGDVGNNRLWVRSSDGSNPAMSFTKDGVDNAQLSFSGYEFQFINTNSTGYFPVKANGYTKNGSSDSYLLTGGGGHKLISDFALAGNLSGYVTLSTEQNINSQKTFLTGYDTYTPDGLFDVNAKPLRTTTPSSNRILLGYKDYGGGQYYPRMGFKNDPTLFNWSLGPLGNDFVIGINNDGTETFKIRPSGAISKNQNNTQIFNRVYQGYYDFGTNQGILAIKMPQASLDQAMFSIDINIYGYQNKYVGKINVSFYKYVSGTIINEGSVALLDVTDNFPTDIVRVGIGTDGYVSILLGNPNTVWEGYFSFEVARVQVQYGNWYQDWSLGWSHAIESDLNQYSGSNKLIDLPVHRVATISNLNSYVKKSGDTMTGQLNALTISAQNATDKLIYDNIENYGSPLTINANASLGIYLQANGNNMFYVGPSYSEFFNDLYITSGKVISNYNTNSNQWGRAYTHGLVDRGVAFVSNVDANNLANETGITSIETGNGSGNTNFPFYGYGNFLKMSSRSFTSEFVHQNDGNLYHRNWYLAGNPNDYPFRKIWDDINLEDYHQYGLGKLYLESLADADTYSGRNTGFYSLNVSLHAPFQYGTVLKMMRDGNEGGEIAVSTYGGQFAFREYVGGTYSQWYYTWHTGNFNPAQYVTQTSLNTQLANYATLNGVQTFTNTNTFTQSPVIPNGTLGTHAVNLKQLNDKADRNGSNATDTWANAAKMLVTNPYIPGRTMNGSGTAYLNEATYGDVHGFLNSSGTAQGNPTDNWFHRIKMLHSNSSGYFTEIGVQMTGGNSMHYRRYENGTDYGWVQVWDKENLSQANINNWNIAYGWGNHANAGYATGTWVNTNFIPKSHPVYNITQANINSWNAAASGSSHTHSNLSYLNNIDQWLGVGQAPRFNSVFLMDAFGYGQLVLGEGNIGGESGLVDISNKRFYAGRINEYLKYGSSIDGFEGLNIHFDEQLLGIGRELGNHEDKVQLAGDLSVDTIDINHNSRQLILNPLYNTDGDVRHSRNAHIYIVTRNAVTLPDKPILGQRIEIFNDSDSGIEVTHSNVGTMFKIPGFCKVTGIAANKGFRFDAEPVYTKQYDI